MEQREAMAWLVNGHGVLPVEVARQICEAVGVAFEETLILRWQSGEDALRKYAFVPFEPGPGAGVDSLDVSYHLAWALGLGAPGDSYVGRDDQARANVEAIMQHFGLMEEG